MFYLLIDKINSTKCIVMYNDCIRINSEINKYYKYLYRGWVWSSPSRSVFLMISIYHITLKVWFLCLSYYGNQKRYEVVKCSIQMRPFSTKSARTIFKDGRTRCWFSPSTLCNLIFKIIVNSLEVAGNSILDFENTFLGESSSLSFLKISKFQNSIYKYLQ